VVEKVKELKWLLVLEIVPTGVLGSWVKLENYSLPNGRKS
jgi:hypothetical protein